MECFCGFEETGLHGEWCELSDSNTKSEAEYLLAQSGSFFEDFLFQGLDYDGETSEMVFARSFTDGFEDYE